MFLVKFWAGPFANWAVITEDTSAIIFEFIISTPLWSLHTVTIINFNPRHYHYHTWTLSSAQLAPFAAVAAQFLSSLIYIWNDNLLHSLRVESLVTCKNIKMNYLPGYNHRSRCFFPKAWHGEYFHLGYNSPLMVVNNSISGKGRCVENFGSHYVMEDMEYGEKCWKCMTIYRKHQNVLSYKESK